MANINSTISIITQNVNGLNKPLKGVVNVDLQIKVTQLHVVCKILL